MEPQPSLIRRFDDTGVPLLIARLVVGGVFIRFAAAKLGSDPVEFLKLIRQYEILPETPPIFLNGTAVILPWLEVVCGLALILGFGLRGASVLIAGMLLFFTPAVLMRGLGIAAETGQAICQVAFNCGCGTGEENVCEKVAMNTGLLALTIFAIFSRSRRFTIEGLMAGAKASDQTAKGEAP